MTAADRDGSSTGGMLDLDRLAPDPSRFPDTKILRQLRDLAFPRRIDAAKHDALGRLIGVVSSTCCRMNGVAATTSGTVSTCFSGRIVVGHAFFHAVLHDDVRGGPENLGLNVFLEAGHDADRADQGRDAQGDAGDRRRRYSERSSGCGAWRAGTAGRLKISYGSATAISPAAIGGRGRHRGWMPGW